MPRQSKYPLRYTYRTCRICPVSVSFLLLRSDAGQAWSYRLSCTFCALRRKYPRCVLSKVHFALFLVAKVHFVGPGGQDWWAPFGAPPGGGEPSLASYLWSIHEDIAYPCTGSTRVRQSGATRSARGGPTHPGCCCGSQPDRRSDTVGHGADSIGRAGPARGSGALAERRRHVLGDERSRGR